MQQTYQTAARAPLTPKCATRKLALTTTDASVTLPAGGYELILDGTSDAVVLGLGIATTGLPSTSETEGIAVIPSGGVGEFILDAETAVHARTLSGTGNANFTRKVVG